ncbi:hypothetical protein PLICRDRAFT_291958 [Plicaturopsis crispa FD-325 SS-3]|nr:hypothetical protein PLICRDRAFT_291958 [Plicaturopsis crispa FD-325 SS-3]
MHSVRLICTSLNAIEAMKSKCQNFPFLIFAVPPHTFAAAICRGVTSVSVRIVSPRAGVEGHTFDVRVLVSAAGIGSVSSTKDAENTYRARGEQSADSAERDRRQASRSQNPRDDCSSAYCYYSLSARKHYYEKQDEHTCSKCRGSEISRTQPQGCVLDRDASRHCEEKRRHNIPHRDDSVRGNAENRKLIRRGLRAYSQAHASRGGRESGG